MTKLLATTVVTRVDGSIAETEFEDEVVLLHVENGEYYNFNDTASALWQWLKEPKSVSQLATLLAEKYECTESECQPDIVAWLEQTANKGLIKVVTQ